MSFFHWNLTKDLLPEDGQAVIGCDRKGYITRFEFSADEPPCWIDDHEEFFRIDEIVAWMKLPEAYKEGKFEEGEIGDA